MSCCPACTAPGVRPPSRRPALPCKLSGTYHACMSPMMAVCQRNWQPRRTEQRLDETGPRWSPRRACLFPQLTATTALGSSEIVADARVTRGAPHLPTSVTRRILLPRGAMAEAPPGRVAQRADRRAAGVGSAFCLRRDLRRKHPGVSLDALAGGDLPGDRPGRRAACASARTRGRNSSSVTGGAFLEEWPNRCVEHGDLEAIAGAGPRLGFAPPSIAMLTEASLAIARSATPAQTRLELGIVLDRMLTRSRLLWP